MPRTRTAPRRKATNLSLDQGLLDEARALDINISRACERGLAEQIAQSRAERWRRENTEAVSSSNQFVERHGLPIMGFRRF